MPSAEWNLDADPDEVGHARRAATRFAHENDVANPPLEDMALAISEALTNIVLHAYRDAEPGTFSMTVDVKPAEQRVQVLIRDSGAGVAPRPDSTGLGLGLPLIAQVTESFELHDGPDGVGTEVRMTFKVP